MISDDLRKLENKKDKKYSPEVKLSNHITLQQINSSPRQMKY